MRKQPQLIIKESAPQINLNIGTGFTSSTTGSTLDNQKYHVDDIEEATPCTVLYVNGSTSRTIEVVDTIVMSGHIMHGRFIPS
jgi:hypothetical protein